MTRQLNPPLDRARARDQVKDLIRWQPQQVIPSLFERAWEIEDRWQLSWWDSLIVAAAIEADCRLLLTEDLQDGLQIEGLQISNPFTPDFSLAHLQV